ncbi:transcriptional regulator [Blastococcus sp. KM273128]|uniref:helix-turn-helix transcriptional regulator n=1 Tax=Blastococcus sp. KM273128 TaxID=2570314 RepID=UPI001F21F8A5|nr:helix-turn-helix domain-containing protein [Blastococcus sp. KM273128]MCF6744707.1 transcriptional regulator [Blastococcus sp. KM273128]
MPSRSTSATDTPAERRYAALAVRSRRRMLGVLRAEGCPMDVPTLAEAVGLHRTTARLHLQVMEAAGLVAQLPARPRGPGRPRLLYAAVPQADDEGHRQLADLLAGALGSGGDDGSRRAEEAGRRWAAAEFPESQTRSPELAAGDVGALFDRLGFAPRVEMTPAAHRLALQRCPFRDTARAHPRIVCALHLGLMRGALLRLGQPGLASAARLEPFVTPDLCVAEFPRAAEASLPDAAVPRDNG